MGTKKISVNESIIKFLDGKDFPDDDTILKITKALDTTYEKLATDENSEESRVLINAVNAPTEEQITIVKFNKDKNNSMVLNSID